MAMWPLLLNQGLSFDGGVWLSLQCRYSPFAFSHLSLVCRLESYWLSVCSAITLLFTLALHHTRTIYLKFVWFLMLMLHHHIFVLTECDYLTHTYLLYFIALPHTRKTWGMRSPLLSPPFLILQMKFCSLKLPFRLKLLYAYGLLFFECYLNPL